MWHVCKPHNMKLLAELSVFFLMSTCQPNSMWKCEKVSENCSIAWGKKLFEILSISANAKALPSSLCFILGWIYELFKFHSIDNLVFFNLVGIEDFPSFQISFYPVTHAHVEPSVNHSVNQCQHLVIPPNTLPTPSNPIKYTVSALLLNLGVDVADSRCLQLLIERDVVRIILRVMDSLPSHCAAQQVGPDCGFSYACIVLYLVLCLIWCRVYSRRFC